MDFDYPKIISTLLVWAIPVIFAVTVHEVAHGYVASKLGDKTALMLGRITLNPIKHIDIIGTIIVPLLFLMVGGFIFGWAKPVPVDWRNLKNPRRDMVLVALAGPGANLLMAILWAIFAKICLEFSTSFGILGKLLFSMGIAGIAINLMLMLLNLIPIPPLDGSRVVSSLLDRKSAMMYESLERYGFIIFIALIFSGILSTILTAPYNFLQQVFFNIFGLSH